MKDINARKAIALALNNEEIVQGAYGSEDLAIPATNFCSPENLYYNDEMKGYQQNIEEAEKACRGDRSYRKDATLYLQSESPEYEGDSTDCTAAAKRDRSVRRD